MTNVIERSNRIWDWVISGNYKYKLFRGFREILKLENTLKMYGYQYDKFFQDGGLTIVFRDGKRKLGTARENCFSEGCAMDLVEVYGLYGSDFFIGFCDSDEAFSYFMNAMRKYKSKSKKLFVDP